MEYPTIKDLDGKVITITDMPKAMAEAEMYVNFSEADKNEGLLKHWSHVLSELKKIKPIELSEPVKILNDATKYSDEVTKARAMFRGNEGNGKWYIKNGASSPIFPAHSCARSRNKIRHIEALEIGESTNNSTPTKITRIF